MAQSLRQGVSIVADEREVCYGPYNQRSSVSATVIHKTYEHKTHLVLQCLKVPELEGIVVNRDLFFAQRPFCAYAHYDAPKSIVAKNDLTRELGLLDLLPPPKMTALNLLMDLLARNNLEIGKSFCSNILKYSRQMKSEEVVKFAWDR